MKGNYTEPRICTMVGRDPENPSSRVRSDRYEQMIEMGDDVSNTLTSVQKDNLVAEPWHEDYPHVREFNSKEEADAFIESLRIKQATKQGYVEIPPGSVFDASYPDSQTRRGRVQDGGQTSPTLMASGEAPCYYEGVQMVQRPHGFNKGNTHEVSPTVTGSAFQDNNFVEEWKTVVGSKQENSFLGDVNGECPCVTSACGAGGGMTPMVTDASLEQARTDDFREQVRGHQPLHYRIRKLTPRECFRLMGVTEENIDKIQQSGVSQSQQYKMAGNSIVVDCLFHLFRKMFTETENESNQMLLF